MMRILTNRYTGALSPTRSYRIDQGIFLYKTTENGLIIRSNRNRAPEFRSFREPLVGFRLIKQNY